MPITKNTSKEEIIRDFVHSDNPKFAGKSKEERARMAVGAYYGMQRECISEMICQIMDGESTVSIQESIDSLIKTKLTDIFEHMYIENGTALFEKAEPKVKVGDDFIINDVSGKKKLTPEKGTVGDKLKESSDNTGYHIVRSDTNKILSSHPNEKSALAVVRKLPLSIPAVIIGKKNYVPTNESLDEARGFSNRASLYDSVELVEALFNKADNIDEILKQVMLEKMGDCIEELKAGIDISESKEDEVPEGFHKEHHCPYCGDSHFDRAGAFCKKCGENHVHTVNDKDDEDVIDPHTESRHINMFLMTETSNDVETLIENTTAGKKYMVEGLFAAGDIKNGNGRIYESKILHPAMQKYVNEKVLLGRGYGELNHPQSPQVNFERVVMVIENLSAKGSNWHGKAKIVNEGLGKIVIGIMEAGGKIGVSTRALGSLREHNGVKYVNPDLMFSAIDVVFGSLAQGCFVAGILENTNFEMLEDGRVIRLAVDVTKKKINEQRAIKAFAELMLQYGSK